MKKREKIKPELTPRPPSERFAPLWRERGSLSIVEGGGSEQREDRGESAKRIQTFNNHKSKKK